MASETNLTSRAATKFALQTDRRDIKDLWNDALKDYRGIVGKNLQINFKNTDEMLQYGLGQRDTFSKWRHDGKKLDRIRSLFMQNVDYIEMGTQKLLGAATPAFPPAAAISTALTFVLNACKGQSADYDVVACFFEDMNGFLQRVTILEGRLPEHRAYQACLMDVFTSFLAMCAFATKFISKGRLKTWIINSFIGQDADLSSARNRMDKNIKTLESATEIAILANTEGLKGGQQGLQLMQEELRENQIKQYELAQEQTRLLENIQQGQTAVQEGVDDLETGVQAILAMMKQDPNKSTTSANEQSRNSLNKVSTEIKANIENNARVRKLRTTRLAGTGEWLFQTPAWKSWFTSPDASFLLVQGPPGIGKTYLASAAHSHLRQATEADPERLSVVICFFCDDDADTLQTFASFISSVVLQMSDQNPVLRDRFGQILTMAREADKWHQPMSEYDYWQELIVPCFGKDSKYRLHIIIDSVDQLKAHAADDWFAYMVNQIDEQALNVKILATLRSAPLEALTSPLQSRFKGLSNLSTLVMSKDDVHSDIKMLIADRIKVNDKIQGNLAHLRSKTQRKITDHIEEKADTLLYVNFAFRHLSGVGREGAIVRELEIGLANETGALFEGIMKRCKRHLPNDLEAPVQLLLVWLTYSFDLLDLDQANQLVKFKSQDEHVRMEDEIEYAFGRILQIGPTTKISNEDTDLDIDRTLKDTAFVENAHDDGNLLVSLRDQSMKKLLRNIDIMSWGHQNITTNGQSVHKPVDTSSASHRLMFLLCCEVLGCSQDNKTSTNTSSGGQKLRQYAAKHCLRHWQHIDCDRHEDSENMEVCDAFYNLLRNRYGFPAVYESEMMELETTIKRASTMSAEIGFQIFFETWQRWAKFVREATTSRALGEHEQTRQKDVEMESYWRAPHGRALVPLFEAHMENWLDDWLDDWLDNLTDSSSVINSCRAALEAHEKISDSDLPTTSASDEYWKSWSFPDECRAWGGSFMMADAKAIYTMRTSWRYPLTSTAHFATALSLGSHCADEVAYRELQVAAEKCSDMGQKSMIYIGLSELCEQLGWGDNDDDNDNLTENKEASRRESYKEALAYLDSALELIPDKTSPTRLSVLVGKLGLLERYKRFLHDKTVDSDIAKIVCELRADPSVWTIDNVNLLSKESAFLSESHNQVIDFFTGLTPIQKVAAVMRLDRPLNSILLPAAVLTRRTADLQAPYYEILDTLNLGGCGFVWYTTLVHYLHRAIKDLHLASDVLRLALSHVFTGPSVIVASGSYEATWLSEKWLNLASDVVYQQLRSSNTPDAKFAFLQEAETLSLQPMVQSVQMNTTSMLPYLIVLAQMQKRLGSFGKYQATLQQAFDICWNNLHDNFTTNDSTTLRCLSKILALGPTSGREAEIISSAQLYKLGNTPTSEASDEGKEADEGNENDKRKEVSEVKDTMEDVTYDYVQPKNWDDPFAYCSNAELGHLCSNNMCWSTWKESMYTCLCCTDSFLCQDCHDERIKRNIPGEAKDKLDFCCDGGEYLKAPVAGWKGIKDGIIYIKDEKPIKVDAYLDQLRETWKQEWEDFWKG